MPLILERTAIVVDDTGELPGLIDPHNPKQEINLMTAKVSDFTILMDKLCTVFWYGPFHPLGGISAAGAPTILGAISHTGLEWPT